MRTLLELYPGDHISLLAANVLVQVTVVMLLAWAVARGAARPRPAARHDVWLCALLGVLSSPLIAYTLAQADVSIVSLPFLPAEQVEPSLLVEEPAAAQEPPIEATPFVAAPYVEEFSAMPEPAPEPVWEPPLDETGLLEAASLSEVSEEAEEAEITLATLPTAPTLSTPQPTPLSRADELRALGVAVAMIWAVGVLLLLTRTIHGWRTLARLRRYTRPLGNDKLDEIAEQVRRTLGIRRMPRIVVAADLGSPITVGVIRPLLILPKQLTRTLRRDQLRDVLLHECAHVARRDHLVGMLQLLAEMLFWPHPLVHVMNRQLARSREEVCDNYVLRHGDGPRYAQTLLELSRKLVPTTARFAALGLCQPRWRLEDRIGGLLDKRRRTMTRMNVCLKSLTACVLLTAATLVAGTRIVEARPEGPPTSDAEAIQRHGEPSTPDVSRKKAPLARRDAESNGLIGIPSKQLVKRYGPAQSHANAEGPDKIVGHFYTKIRPGQVLVIRGTTNSNFVKDAYWCDSDKKLEAWRNPPPAKDIPPAAGDTSKTTIGDEPDSAAREAAARAKLSKRATGGKKRLFGRVVNDQGKPIPGVEVSVVSVRQHPLRQALRIWVRTDRQGRFDVSAPLPDMKYYVLADGHGGTSSIFAPGTGKEIVIVINKRKHHELSGVVRSESGKPVAGATVVLVGEYRFRAKQRTDDKGRYRMDVVNNLGQAVVYAETDKLISPYRMVRNRDRSVDFTLAAPAELKGVVKDQLSGKPVGGCAVTLKPYFSSDFTRTATADDAGRFSLVHLPPGKYEARVSSDTHYEPPTHGSSLDRPDFPLTAGRTAFRQLDLRPVATIVGRVLRHDGQPAAGAFAGLKAFWDTNNNRQFQRAEADAQGRFLIRTGCLRETLRITGDCGGFAQIKLKGAIEGETLDLGDVRLSGAVEIRGTVSDPDGKPVAGVFVKCFGCGPGGQGEVITGADGRFDLGRLALHADPSASLSVIIIAPRPGGTGLQGVVFFGGEEAPSAPEPEVQRFHHQEIKLKATPGKEFTLDVKLKPAEQLAFSGRVVDSKGKPVPGARVVCFLGDASKTWHRQFMPSLAGLSGGCVFFHPEVQLGSAMSHADGKWIIHTVRENAEDLRLNYHHTARLTPRYSFGVIGSQRQTKLFRDITVDKKATSKSVDLILPPRAPSVISGRVVDIKGQPIAGVTLDLGNTYGANTRIAGIESTVTGDDGRFTIPVDNSTSTTFLRIEAKGRSIQSPTPDRHGRGLRLSREGGGFTDLKIVMAGTGVVTGSVRWSSGKPVIDYKVHGYLESSKVTVPQQRITGGGEFKFAAFPSGSGRIWISTPSGVTAARGVEVAPGGSTRIEIVVPVPNCVVRGRVVDAKGKPVAGTRASISGRDNDGFEFVIREATPDVDGSFKFKVPPGVYNLTVRLDDRDAWSKSLPKASVKVIEGKPTAEVILTVHEKAWSDLTVEVVDRDGRPLPGVTVQSGGFGHSGTAPIGETNAAGKFLIRGVKAGSHQIVLTDPKRMLKENMRLTITVPADKSVTHRIVLDAGRRVRGRVTCNGRPVNNIHVMTNIGSQNRYSSTHTGEDGVFQLVNVPDGKLTICCRSYMSNQTVKKTFDIDADRDDIEIKLPTGRITGKILDRHGDLLPGRAVKLEQLKVYGSAVKAAYAVSHDCKKGLIDLPHLGDGQYRLTLAEGYGDSNVAAVLAVGDPIEIRNGKTVEDFVIRVP